MLVDDRLGVELSNFENFGTGNLSGFSSSNNTMLARSIHLEFCMHQSNSQKDLQLLLAFVVAASLLLFGIGVSSVVQVSTRDTGLWTKNVASW